MQGGASSLQLPSPLSDGRFADFAMAAAECIRRASPPMAQTIADAYARATCAPIHPQNALQHFPTASPQLHDDICSLASQPPPDALPLVSWVAQIAPYLQWRAAGGGDCPALGAVELIGPSGIVFADDCRSGLFYQPRNYYYAYHHHAAEELYVQLCGGGVWYADDEVAGKSGAVVHHRAWQPHALATDDLPLLAIWGWCGNLDMDSYAMCGG